MLKQQGQPTPLDAVPEVSTFQAWFLNTYWKLKKLSTSEGLISIVEYVYYMSVYPVLVDSWLFIDIMVMIDTQVTSFHQRQRELKRNNGKSKNPNRN